MAECCTPNNTCWPCSADEAQAIAEQYAAANPEPTQHDYMEQEFFAEVAAGVDPYVAADKVGIPIGELLDPAQLAATVAWQEANIPPEIRAENTEIVRNGPQYPDVVPGAAYQPPVSQPPIVSVQTDPVVPPIAQAQPHPSNIPATGNGGTGWMAWFSGSTALFGYGIPNWGLAVAGVGVVLLMRGKGKR